MANAKKEKHKCPPIPAGWGNLKNPAYEPGDSVAIAKAKWAAHGSKVGTLTPMPRKTH